VQPQGGERGVVVSQHRAVIAAQGKIDVAADVVSRIDDMIERHRNRSAGGTAVAADADQGFAVRATAAHARLHLRCVDLGQADTRVGDTQGRVACAAATAQAGTGDNGGDIAAAVIVDAVAEAGRCAGYATPGCARGAQGLGRGADFVAWRQRRVGAGAGRAHPHLEIAHGADEHRTEVQAQAEATFAHWPIRALDATQRHRVGQDRRVVQASLEIEQALRHDAAGLQFALIGEGGADGLGRGGRRQRQRQADQGDTR
jgi:hypothetical protein